MSLFEELNIKNDEDTPERIIKFAECLLTSCKLPTAVIHERNHVQKLIGQTLYRDVKGEINVALGWSKMRREKESKVRHQINYGEHVIHELNHVN